MLKIEVLHYGIRAQLVDPRSFNELRVAVDLSKVI